MVDYDAIFENMEFEDKTQKEENSTLKESKFTDDRRPHIILNESHVETVEVERVQEMPKSVHVPETCIENSEKATHANVFDLEIAKSKLDGDNVNDLVEIANQLTIKTDEDAKQGVTLAMQARKMTNSIEKARMAIVRPHLDFQRAVKKYADGFSTCLKGMEKSTLKKVEKFQADKEKVLKMMHQEQMKKEAEAMRLLKEAAKDQHKEGEAVKEINLMDKEPEKVEVFIPPTKKIAVDDGISTTIVEWVFDIESVKDIPVKYMQVNERAIKEAVRAGVRNIPGVKIYEKKRQQYRVKK